MALKLASKAPGAVLRYVWTPQILEGDGIASVSLSVRSGDAVIDSYAIEQDGVAFFLSGGTAGTTTIIDASAVSDEDETLPETIYIAIISRDHLLGNTVRDVCDFALRPIVGIGGAMTPDELADAQEHLDDMLAQWAMVGADLGVSLPTAAGDTLQVSDAALSAIKHNLRLRVSETYGQPISQMAALEAMRGLQQVKSALLPSEREGSEFY